MSQENNLYCALAFNSISFGSYGGSRPCCAVDTHYWKEKNTLRDYNNDLVSWFNNDDIVNLRKDLLDNKWNPICNSCKMREDVGQKSTRQIFNDALHDIETTTNRNWKTEETNITNFENIFYLDITTGNKCNSACLMCHEAASSFWAKEREEMTGKPVYTHPYLDWFNAENVISMVDKLPNLKKINFLGGEPTIHEAVPALLKHLVNQGRSKDISIAFVTNLTGITDEMLELWSNFDRKFITVSIDGVDKVNEYIRYPFAWKKVNSQFEAVKNIAKEKGDYFIYLSHTVTSLNLLTLGDMIKWWESHQGGTGIATHLPHIQCVNFPKYLDPKYTPKALKDKAEIMLAELEEYLKTNNILNKYRPAIENIRNNVINFEVSEQTRLEYWKQMRDHIESLDKHRKRNIFEYLPYMKEFWVFE